MPGCRGEFHVDADTVRGPTGHLPDTYIGVRQWSKGLAFINGFNLGWYWPKLGPQGAQYVPGPLLKAGSNEIILVEVEDAPVKGDSKHNPSGNICRLFHTFADRWCQQHAIVSWPTRFDQTVWISTFLPNMRLSA